MSPLERLRPAALAAPASGIVAVMNYGRTLEGVIPLWTGEGDLATPQFIRDAAAKSLAAQQSADKHTHKGANLDITRS